MRVNQKLVLDAWRWQGNWYISVLKSFSAEDEVWGGLPFTDSGLDSQYHTIGQTGVDRVQESCHKHDSGTLSIRTITP